MDACTNRYLKFASPPGTRAALIAFLLAIVVVPTTGDARAAQDEEQQEATSSIPRGKKRPGNVPSWSGPELWFAAPPKKHPQSGVPLRAVVGWMQTVSDPDQPGPGSIEVDWIRLHAVVRGKDRVIMEDDYENADICGGLWVRNPWFASEDRDPLPHETKDGIVTMPVSEHPDSVFHWWNCRRVNVPAGTTRIWMEARVRIHGNAAVEAGYDYYESLDSPVKPRINHAEGARGEWYFAADDWQIVTAAKPAERKARARGAKKADER